MAKSLKTEQDISEPLTVKCYEEQNRREKLEFLQQPGLGF
jgi:hypothetical protein